MKKWIKIFTLTLVPALTCNFSFSQDHKDNKVKELEEKLQEIVIRKKEGKAEKMTIVIDGDNVTINGKPVEEFKNKDIAVFKRKRPGVLGAFPKTPVPPGFALREGDFDHLVASGMNRPVLGILTGKAEDGVKVTEVTEESGADKAGIKKDDIITKIGDKEVKSPAELVNTIKNYKPKEKVDITYKRNGKEIKTSAVLGENKSPAFSYKLDNRNFNFDIPRGVIPPMENFNLHFTRRPKIGLQIQDVTEGKGVLVKDVDDESAAAKAGIKEGDVIMQVNGKDVMGVEELRKEIIELKEGETVTFSYKRGNKIQAAEIKIPKRIKTADL